MTYRESIRRQISQLLASVSFSCRRSRSAFTLVELLVVISIIGILMGLLFPALQAVRQSARRSQCTTNLRQLILATINYESSHMKYPPGDNSTSGATGVGGSANVLLLDLLSQAFLAERAAEELASGETFENRYQELSGIVVEPLICPAAVGADGEVNLPNQGNFTTHYYGVTGPTGTATASDRSLTYQYKELNPVPAGGPIGLQGLFSPTKTGKFRGRDVLQIRDGISYSFAFGEVSGKSNDDFPIERGGWAFGVEFSGGEPVATYSVKSVSHQINTAAGQINDEPFSSNHAGGAQFALIDGAVLFVDDEVSVDVLKTYSSIDEVEKPEDLNPF